MPTYEYACKACGEHLEVVQSFRDDALTTCPSCGGELRKVFGAIGIAFKGSGFYKTDSRSSTSSGPKPKKDTEGSSPAAASSDGASSDKAASSGSSSSSSSSSSSPSSPAAGKGDSKAAASS
jgi:putative FmdB family regulatory protein